jgi:hypothetical protein
VIFDINYTVSYDIGFNVEGVFGQAPVIAVQSLTFRRVPGQSDGLGQIDWIQTPGTSRVSPFGFGTASPLAEQASWSYSRNDSSVVEAFGISIGAFSRCVFRASNTVTGCTNCGDTNTGAALI